MLHLAIGNGSEAYNCLNTGLFADVKAILDCSQELPTKKWKRKESEVEVYKVSLSRLTKDKLERALDFIHEVRRTNRLVMVVCKDGSLSQLVCAVYLMLRKELSLDDAMKQVGGTLNETDRQFVEKFIEQYAPVV